MIKKFLAVLLVFFLSAALFANEYGESDSSAKGFDWNVRMGVSFPLLIINTGYSNDLSDLYSEMVLIAVAFSAISVSGGLQYTVIPNIFTPGIYADFHFNLLSWGIIYMIANESFYIMQTGARVYNQFKLNNIGIEPFFGLNMVSIGLGIDDSISINLLAAGLTINFGIFNMEYGYNFSPKKSDNDLPIAGIHRISLSWRLNPIKK